jgi:8-oxo-dGTP pyrophosphatase MutT (NUDIX family)
LVIECRFAPRRRAGQDRAVDANGPWQVRSSRVVYENPWLRLREDQVVRPDGRDGIYGVVEFPGSVTVLAVGADGRAPLVSQWRYPVRRESLELPTGAIDPDDASPLEAARRELWEEVGWRAAHWESLGSVDNSNGATTDTTYLFLALDAGPAAGWQPSQEDASTLTHSQMSMPELRRAALEGRITAGPSVATVLLASALAGERTDPVWLDLRRRLGRADGLAPGDVDGA